MDDVKGYPESLPGTNVKNLRDLGICLGISEGAASGTLNDRRYNVLADRLRHLLDINDIDMDEEALCPFDELGFVQYVKKEDRQTLDISAFEYVELLTSVALFEAVMVVASDGVLFFVEPGAAMAELFT